MDEIKHFLILSDVHGASKDLSRLLKKHEKNFSGLFFSGDGLRAFQGLSLPLSSFLVRGNCDDSCSEAPEEMLFTLESLKIWLLHGHRYGVKNGLAHLESEARKKTASLVLFGHTHLPYRQEKDGIWFFNPGSFAEGVYGVLSLHRTEFYLEHEYF